MSNNQNYGLPGDPIDGSVYYRAYCFVCHEPIRTASRDGAIRGDVMCDACRACHGAIVRERWVGSMPWAQREKLRITGG